MISNLPQYIQKVELAIQEKKKSNGRKFIQLSIHFESPYMVENLKRYFKKEGYKFWYRTCTRGLTDYEISW